MDAQLDSEAMGIEMGSDAKFTSAEATEMKHLYDKLGKDCPDAQFYEELADKFNKSIHRRGKSLIKWEQVYDWFQDQRSMDLSSQMNSVKPTVMEVDKVSYKRISVDKVSDERVSGVKVSNERVSVRNGKELEYQLPENGSCFAIKSYRKTKVVKFSDEMVSGVKVSDERVSVRKGKEIEYELPNNYSSFPIKSYRKTKAAAAEEISNLLYEAKSRKDLAWYDVKLFLNYRHTSSGELEALVRFATFGKDEDEWLNMKRCIRQRSVPLRASECNKVKIGDLVLCFRKSEDDAVFRDAHVLGIESNKHDETEGCTCIFVVCYDHDSSEDRVRLSNICVRPTS